MKKILMIVMALLMLGGCEAKSDLIETTYNFPVMGEDLNNIIKEENLPWSVGDEIPLTDSVGYYIKNGNGNNTVRVNSNLQGESRSVIVELLSSENDSSGKTERLDGETIPNMFTMAARIYGLGALSEAEKVYSDIIDYMKRRTANEYGPSVFESKYGENYFSVGIDIKDGNYNLSFIRIDNQSSYENIMNEEAKQWANNLSLTMPITENSNIQELRDTESEGVLILKGNIVKQSRIPEEKAKLLKSIDQDGNQKNISRYDYVDAIFANGDDKISVILKINGLGEDEIKEERTHYIYYSPENTVGVVEYMVK